MKVKKALESETVERSPPSRGRGLKVFFTQTRLAAFLVAPLAGAWIERKQIHRRRMERVSPPSRGRGLKDPAKLRLSEVSGRPPRGGVD